MGCVKNKYIVLPIYYAFIIISLLFTAGNSYGISIKLGWNPPQRGEVNGYRLYYGLSSGLYDYVIDARNTTVKAVRLKKGYQYYIVVTAYNEFGESEPSNELLVDTCTYKLSPAKKTMKQAGGIASVKVKTQPDCQWSASSGADWMTIIDGEEGMGNGVITCSVEPNDTYETRMGISTFADKVFTLKQKGIKKPK